MNGFIAIIFALVVAATTALIIAWPKLHKQAKARHKTGGRG